MSIDILPVDAAKHKAAASYQVLAQGRNINTHCAGGIGRTGMEISADIDLTPWGFNFSTDMKERIPQLREAGGRKYVQTAEQVLVAQMNAVMMLQYQLVACKKLLGEQPDFQIVLPKNLVPEALKMNFQAIESSINKNEFFNHLSRFLADPNLNLENELQSHKEQLKNDDDAMMDQLSQSANKPAIPQNLPKKKTYDVATVNSRPKIEPSMGDNTNSKQPPTNNNSNTGSATHGDQNAQKKYTSKYTQIPNFNSDANKNPGQNPNALMPKQQPKKQNQSTNDQTDEYQSLSNIFIGNGNNNE